MLQNLKNNFRHQEVQLIAAILGVFMPTVAFMLVCCGCREGGLSWLLWCGALNAGFYGVLCCFLFPEAPPQQKLLFAMNHPANYADPVSELLRPCRPVNYAELLRPCRGVLVPATPGIGSTGLANVVQALGHEVHVVPVSVKYDDGRATVEIGQPVPVSTFLAADAAGAESQ